MRKMLMLAAAIAAAQSAQANGCKPPPIATGWTYGQALASATQHGWVNWYAGDPKLRREGYDEGDQRVISDCNGSVALCNQRPELVSCSHDGHCRMELVKGRDRLVILTYGDAPEDDTVTSAWCVRGK
jgi:hypothetical protein